MSDPVETVLDVPSFDSMELAFIFFTECQLATLDRYETSKSTSKSQLRRQRTIAMGMVEALRRQNVQLPSIRSFPRTPRVRKLIETVSHDLANTARP